MPARVADNTSSSPSHAERLATASCVLAPVTETPRLDAELLLAHALGYPRARLLARLHDRQDVPTFDALIRRRLVHEPIAYILGEWEFFSLTFEASRPVLVPRPETEHLVEVVLEFIGKEPARVLDIGTGTGCVAVAVAHNAPNSSVVATDIDPLALDVAARNIARYGLGQRVLLREGDLFDAVRETGPLFDVVCSNPPYVEEAAWSQLPPVITRYEDPRALLAGEDGLAIIRRLVSAAPPFLRPRGVLALEIGMGQHVAVEALLREHAYEDIRFTRDLAGIQRIVSAQRPR